MRAGSPNRRLRLKRAEREREREREGERERGSGAGRRGGGATRDPFKDFKKHAAPCSPPLPPCPAALSPPALVEDPLSSSRWTAGQLISSSPISAIISSTSGSSSSSVSVLSISADPCSAPGSSMGAAQRLRRRRIALAAHRSQLAKDGLDRSDTGLCIGAEALLVHLLPNLLVPLHRGALSALRVAVALKICCDRSDIAPLVGAVVVFDNEPDQHRVVDRPFVRSFVAHFSRWFVCHRVAWGWDNSLWNVCYSFSTGMPPARRRQAAVAAAAAAAAVAAAAAAAAAAAVAVAAAGGGGGSAIAAVAARSGGRRGLRAADGHGRRVARDARSTPGERVRRRRWGWRRPAAPLDAAARSGGRRRAQAALLRHAGRMLASARRRVRCTKCAPHRPAAAAAAAGRAAGAAAAWRRGGDGARLAHLSWLAAQRRCSVVGTVVGSTTRTRIEWVGGDCNLA